MAKAIFVGILLLLLLTQCSSDQFPPFVVTNIGVEKEEQPGKAFFSQASGETENAYILNNIVETGQKVGRYPEYQGTIIYSSAWLKDTVFEISSGGRVISSLNKTFTQFLHIFESHDNRPLLFYVHGFSVTPENALNQCSAYNNRSERVYNAVPVIWDTTHSTLAYKDNRADLASSAGETFGHSFGRLFNLFSVMMRQGKKKYLMCHGMGNYVLQSFAQFHRESGAKVGPFESIFMVAADVREDTFDATVNGDPDEEAPMEGYLDTVIYGITYFTDWSRSSADYDNLANPGMDIAALVRNKVYVLWSKKDKALLFRRLFQKSRRRVQVGAGNIINRLSKKTIVENPTTKALGANGDRKHIHHELAAKVHFENCDEFNTKGLIKHNYQWDDASIQLYENVD